MLPGSPYPRVEASELVALTAQGDTAAFERIYDEYSADVFGVAMTILRDRALAEDATQDTFMAVFRSAASFRPDMASLRTWIVLIARRRSIDILRRRRSHRVEFGVDLTMRPDDVDLWEDVARNLDRDAIAAMLDRLPAEQRNVIELTFVRGLTHTEIARETGAPLGTVKGRARLALRSIRRMALASRSPLADTSPIRRDVIADAQQAWPTTQVDDVPAISSRHRVPRRAETNGAQVEAFGR